MKQPDPDTVKAMATVVRQFPHLYTWVDSWYMHELEQLPNVGQNVAHAQGRCQVLKELRNLLHKAPDLAAKS